MESAGRIKILRDQIEHHNYQYYQENKPEISDSEFDKLLRDLNNLEKKFPDYRTPDSPTQKVGGSIGKGFAVAQHKYPMLSISNTYTPVEIYEFENRVVSIIGEENKVSYLAELKIDGVALSVIYEYGLMERGITRGDGTQGDVVTENIKTIKSIPLAIKTLKKVSYFEVRGEVYFNKSDFQKLNRRREEEGLPIFANPRNSASGTLKMLDSKEVSKRNLRFFAYGLVKIDKKITIDEMSTQDSVLSSLKKYGFKVNNNYKLCKSISEVLKFCDLWDKKRKNLDYETDGMVIKVNKLSMHNELGSTAKSSRAVIAYKYAAEEAQTILEDITYQVGRTGVVTPVAKLKPISLGGTTVSRATLHNAEEIGKKDIRLGDTVIIEKGGEIIPKVIRVVMETRPAKSKKFVFPEKCPICHSSLVHDKEEVAIRCININCSAQIMRSIEHFASRTAMNIENLGPAIIEQLVENGLILNYKDLYYMNKDKLMKLDRMAEKSVNNLLESLEKSKKNPFSKLIYALGIRHIGINSARILSQYYNTINKLKSAKMDELEKLEDVGPTMAISILQFFSSQENISIITGLEKAGISMEEKTNFSATNNILDGKFFVLTGTLETYSREEMADKIRNSGGNVNSSISNKTSYLIVGENPGSKLQKANKLKVPVIGEKEILDMLN